MHSLLLRCVRLRSKNKVLEITFLKKLNFAQWPIPTSRVETRNWRWLIHKLTQCEKEIKGCQIRKEDVEGNGWSGLGKIKGNMGLGDGGGVYEGGTGVG